jgi:hypothetical protein
MQVVFIYTGELGVWTLVSYGDSLKIEKDLELFKDTFNSKRFKVIEFDDSLTISTLLSYSNEALFNMGTVIFTDHMSLGKEPLEEKANSVDDEGAVESTKTPEPEETEESEASVETFETDYSATDESKEFSGFYDFNSEDDEASAELEDSNLEATETSESDSSISEDTSDTSEDSIFKDNGALGYDTDDNDTEGWDKDLLSSFDDGDGFNFDLDSSD